MKNPQLANYSTHWLQYQVLWAKYHQDTFDGDLPIIMSQEMAILCSLKLKRFFELKAQTLNMSEEQIEEAFKQGALQKPAAPSLSQSNLECCIAQIYASSRLHTSSFLPPILATDIAQARKDIQKFGLFFDFCSLDDLFLSNEKDEMNKKSVYCIE